MQVITIETPSLGDRSYVVHDGEVALVVDAQRDIERVLEAVAAAGVRVTHVAETHLHNDYVSGAPELAALTGARHVIGAGAEAAYEHQPAREGDAIDIGSLRFTTLDTPGHTPEHVAYTLADRSRADEPLAVFSGGSLLVGAVGRTDLLGEENAVPYARAMFHSLHDKLLMQQDYVGVLPIDPAGPVRAVVRESAEANRVTSCPCATSSSVR